MSALFTLRTSVPAGEPLKITYGGSFPPTDVTARATVAVFRLLFSGSGKSIDRLPRMLKEREEVEERRKELKLKNLRVVLLLLILTNQVLFLKEQTNQ
jgi:hypothetical protein